MTEQEPPVLHDDDESSIVSVRLDPALPVHKAVEKAFIEEGWRDWLTVNLRALKNAAKKGGKMNRTANNAFMRALKEAGHLADAARAFLRRMGVESEQELEQIVEAYRQAQRAGSEDAFEIALATIESELRNRPELREQVLMRLGGRRKDA